ncbi:hypothetical protein MHH60_16015 [Paenibacillus sp. FSL H7-0716]|uniref:hypothetical protein n=1 Tax=Paenibacillus TaxID=44249 RepID=UPI00117FB0BD|nr:hypothetical protein [Paenibacillus odorifer]
MLPRWAGGVYCRGGLCGGKLVAEVAWHLEYSAEFAWARGKACCGGRLALVVYCRVRLARGEAY